jgi:hypothetical protein
VNDAEPWAKTPAFLNGGTDEPFSGLVKRLRFFLVLFALFGGHQSIELVNNSTIPTSNSVVIITHSLRPKLLPHSLTAPAVRCE